MTDQRLRKRERLTSKKDIDRVFEQGVWSRGPLLSAAAVFNHLEHTRLGVGVSSKLCNAVKRNRLKRLVKEAFRLNKEKIPVGMDIFVTPSVINATFSEIQESLINACPELIKKLDAR